MTIMIMHRLFNGGWRIVTRVVLRGVNVDKRTNFFAVIIDKYRCQLLPIEDHLQYLLL